MAVIRDDLKGQGLNVKNLSRWVTKLVNDSILEVEGDILTTKAPVH